MDKENYITSILFLPTPNKSKSWEELRTEVRHLIGSVYENEDVKNDIANANYLTPTNFTAYDKQLSDKEKRAIDNMCNDSGVIVLFVEGTEAAFDCVDNSTIILKEDKED